MRLLVEADTEWDFIATKFPQFTKLTLNLHSTTKTFYTYQW